MILRDRVCQLGEPHRCAAGWQVHHIRRRSQGGTHDPDNLVLLCGVGHQWVHEHPAQARALGLLAEKGSAAQAGRAADPTAPDEAAVRDHDASREGGR